MNSLAAVTYAKITFEKKVGAMNLCIHSPFLRIQSFYSTHTDVELGSQCD